MQPRLIMKQIDKALDMILRDIEETKEKADMQTYKCYMEALTNIKYGKSYIEVTVPIPKE